MSVNANPLLEATNLSKVFTTGRGLVGRGEIRALDDISFTLAGGEPSLVTLVGESGSGKTTIARLILGLTVPSGGEIRYRGKNIHEMSREEWLTYWKEVQAVFQDPYGIYNAFYKIDRVLEVPIAKFKLASSKAQARQLIEEALDAVDLRPADTLGRYPHQLSGGERQRIMLARLYLLRPQLIIADEPVSMIDVSLRASFLNILLDFEQEYGMSCIFITHNLATGYYLGGKIIILCQGRIVETGNMEAVVHHPRHPYSQLLIASVPPPDPGDRWQQKLGLQVSELRRSVEAERGCIYRDRCPRAFDKCDKAPPQMINVGGNHEVACYLYE
jgi:oligopeptide/dipeptide ABC transporter ATP-binding protein